MNLTRGNDFGTLCEKLLQVRKAVAYIQKDSTNSFHKYKYVSDEQTMAKFGQALDEAGIVTSTNVELVGGGPGHCIVKAEVLFIFGDSQIQGAGLGEGTDKGDKATMKAETAAFKYAYLKAFQVATGDDPEADEATDKSSNGKPTKKKPGSWSAGKVMAAIQSAADMPGLQNTKDHIIALKGTNAYKPAVEAFKAKELTIGATA